ncbi:hypothetical protein C1A50_0926 [Paenibacillus polymyxa]|nr:hypothetical protein C1A50_0926 [Paenibacillus polymyxa]
MQKADILRGLFIIIDKKYNKVKYILSIASTHVENVIF